MSAFYDSLTNFLENRLQTFDPSIDVSDGSSAQNEIIQPLIARLGTDPFEIDIKTFITQRLTETYPDLVVNIGELEDLLVNPLILLLEPYKQELNKIQLNQSLQNSDLLEDAEVDALAANWFETREEGEYTSGTVRLYFTAPQNVTVTTAKTISSKQGLNFYPVQDETITSAQMLFNREGDFYYVDIEVVAESPGDNYNVDAQSIISIEDVPGVIKITNPLPFSGGVPREDNTAFTSRVEQALTERSLVTKRGVVARVNKLFTNVQAIQIIGAGEEGMNRDLLTGTSEGFLHLTGLVITFGNWVFVNNTYFKDVGPQRNITVSSGDTLRFHKAPNIDPSRAITTCKVSQVLWNVGDLYLLQVDKDLGNNTGGFIAILKPGFITISGIPEGMLQATVPDNTVHLGGHSDIYIRPTSDKTLATSLKNITDTSPILNLITGQVSANSNSFSTVAPDPTDLSVVGIKLGDTLVIETGSQVGTYRIIEIGTTLKLDHIFTAAETNLRARILRFVTVNLNNPKNIKLPFNAPVNDLSTTIGSNLFILGTVNIQSFGAVVGDTIEILNGPDVGQYTITGFDNALGGKGPLVNRPAGATSSNLSYSVYSLQNGLEFPIVRVKEIDILDSSNQTTGIKIPYGDAIDIRPICDFKSEGDPSTVLDKKLYMFPDTNNYWNGLADVFGLLGGASDTRYSQRLVSRDGHVRTFPADVGNPISSIEINIPPFTWDGKKNTIMAFVSMKDSDFTADPSNNPQTSPLASAKPGYSLTILSGPNAGTYLIADVRIMELWGRTFQGHNKIALVQIDGEFPTDPIRNCIDFISYGAIAGSGVAPITSIELLKMVEWSTDWTNNLGFYENILIPRLNATLLYFSFPSNTSIVRDLLNSICLSGYIVGPSSKGTLRCYFKDPVSIDLFTDSTNPTLFEKISNDASVKKARVTNEYKYGQVLPQSFDTSDLSDWVRTGSTKTPVDTSYYLTNDTSFARKGVQTGDILEFYPAINDLSARDKMSSSYLCITKIASNEIRLIRPNSVNNSTPMRPGQLLFIDSGLDIGQYTITDVVSDTNPIFIVKINKTLTANTLDYPVLYGFAGTTTANSNVLVDASFPGTANIGDYVTIFSANSAAILTSGSDTPYIGSYKIVALGLGFATLDRTAPFPAFSTVGWVVHKAPGTVPAQTSGGGTQLSNQYVRYRLYDSVIKTRTVSIDWTKNPNPLDPTCKDQIILDAPITQLNSTTNFSHMSPFRIIRPFIKKIPATDMSLNFDNGLYYLDIPTIAIGLGQDFNFVEGTPFKLAGRYEVYGYTYNVHDTNLSFSTKEVTDLVFPRNILPLGVTASQENEITIAGQNIQITYDNAALIDDLQRFFDSPLDRVVDNNPLVRHFLPAYVILNASYIGGSSTDLIAKDLISYIKAINPNVNELRVDAVTRILQKRGARQITLPIEVVAMVHGLDRKIRGIRSTNSIGIDFPVFKGVNKMVYFIPGSDLSGIDPRTSGEQIYLTRG